MTSAEPLAKLKHLVEPVAWAGHRPLPVPPRLRSLLPEGGIRRGSTVAVSGSTSLALTTAAAASAQGHWCAAIGFPHLGVSACSEMGIDLSRFVLVPRPGRQWTAVAAALVDAFDVVLVAPPSAVHQRDAQRLSAKARERRCVLVPVLPVGQSWPGADLRLRCQGFAWTGLEFGAGHLHSSGMKVDLEGRNVAPGTSTLVAQAS